MRWPLFITMLFSAGTACGQDFVAGQKRYPRVRQAFEDKGEAVLANLGANGLAADDLDILIVAYKAEKKLFIYGKAKSDERYARIAEYDICASSGKLGPKRRQGDRQVPEGFYHITHFNPASNYYLSLGINYPNASDRRKSGAADPGGDIYIHGSCVTIGCLPMTDDKIKEIYLYALYARGGGQAKIPVYIFPFEMEGVKTAAYKKRFAGEGELLGFWDNIKEGYDRFAREPKELDFAVDKAGDYTFR